MRRLLVTALVLLVALSAASPAFADTNRQLRSLENGVELADGTGLVLVNLRGALIGSAENASLTITDLPAGAETDILVQGATSRIVDDQTTVYQCENCRFRIFRGKWRVRIQGVGINASFAGDGTLTLSGPEGRLSFAGGLFKPWPTEPQVIKLGD